MCDVCATAFGHFPGCPTLDDGPDYQEDDYQEDDYQEEDDEDDEI